MKEEKVLNYTLGIVGIVTIICLIMLGSSYIKYNSGITAEQIQEIQKIEEELPEMKVVIDDVKKDNKITQSEYDHVIDVSNKVRTGFFK